jgi:hypothetical protein
MVPSRRLIAGAGDERQPPLRGLGERTQQRDPRTGMTSHALRGVPGLERAPARFRYQAPEGRNADIGRDVPDRGGQAGPVKPAEGFTAAGVVDGPRVNPAQCSLRRGPHAVQGGGIALHRLADGVADRLEDMVAGSQAVGGGDETSCSGRRRQRICGVDHFVRDPPRGFGEQVPALDPQDGQVRVILRAGRPRQQVDIDQRMAGPQVVNAAQQ